MRKAAVFLLALLAPAVVLAQPRSPTLTASVDRSRLFVGEQMVLSVNLQGPNVENNGPFPAPDLMPYLWLVNSQGPFAQTSMQIINGSITRSGSLGMKLYFQAKQAGTVTIPPIRYRVGGALVQSDAITVQVMEPSGPGVEPGGTAWQPPADPYLELKLDKSEAYVGEQIVASWYIYYRRPFRNAGLAQVPTAGEFVSEDLGTVSQLDPVTKNFAGVNWQVAYLKGMALFPIKAGNAVIDPLVITYGVPTGERDFFGQVALDQRTVASAPVAVKVKPLPEQGRPADFSGAVGQFKISLDRNAGSVKANEQFKFTMTVEGTAHPDYLPKPEAALSSDFDLYTEAVEKQTTQEKGMALGVRHFKMIIVPHQPGTYELPPFAFSYFDPETGRYRTTQSARIKLSVTGAAAPAAQSEAGQEPAVIRTVGKDLRYIKPDRADLNEQRLWIMSSPLFAAAQLAPLAAVALAFGLRRRSDKLLRDVAFARKSRAMKRSRKAVKEARAAARANDPAPAYALIHRALAGYIADRLNLPDSGMTTADAAVSLDRAGISEEVAKEAEAVLSECDRARFMPGTLGAEGAAKLLDRAQALILRLEKENGK
ncbi:MAG TPA: BatD family protein [bacterium]|nr:BatD family protein [bacterium]